MSDKNAFDLRDFMPYLLNQAAEISSLEFQQYYRARYGMLRTEWRVLFHLGRYGEMTAREICERARMHKTKVSRAVAALQEKRFLTRSQSDTDRRQEQLGLTAAGKAAFDDLYLEAQSFDKKMASRFTPEETAILRRCLMEIARL